MEYLFDSDIISYLYNPQVKEHSIVVNRFSQLNNPDTVQVSDLTLFELEYSYSNAEGPQKEEIRRTITDIENRFKVISLKKDFAQP